MKAVILAGGKGVRLREIIKDIPKPMAILAGKPFLEYLVMYLVRSKINEMVISTGYKAEIIESYFGDGSKWGAQIIYSREDNPLGTGGAVKQAAGLIDDDIFVVLNGDSFFDVDMGDLITYHGEKKAVGTLALVRMEKVSRYGTVDVDGYGRIVNFVEKKDGKGGYINAGIYVFSKEIVTYIPSCGNVSLEKEVFPRLIKEGLFGKVVQGYFVDMGLPEDYLCIRDNSEQTLQRMRFKPSVVEGVNYE